MPPFFITLLAVESGRPLSRTDSRVFAPGAFRWMPPPLTAHVMTTIEVGHFGAVAAASATAIKRVPVSALSGLFPAEDIVDDGDDVALVAIGEFSDAAAGVEAAQLVTEQTLRRVSVQPRAIWVAGDCRVEDDDPDGSPMCDVMWTVFTDYQVAGFTILDTPGMESGVIRIATDEDIAAFEGLSDLGPAGAADWEFRREVVFMEDADEGLTACSLRAAGIEAVTRDTDTGDLIASLAAPEIEGPSAPAAAFEPPVFTQYQRARISAPDSDGWRWISGHVAPLTETAAEVCHLDFPGQCKLAPRTDGTFPWFQSSLGLPLDDGTIVYPGTITHGGPHAPLSKDGHPVGMSSALAHYSDRDLGVAWVVAGQDEFAVWIAGVIRRDITEDQFLDFCASKLSIDYRPVPGGIDLAGLHSVNTPGFVQPLVASSTGTDEPAIIYPGERPDLSGVDPRLVARIEAIEARFAAEDAAAAADARDRLQSVRAAQARKRLGL